MRDFTPDDIQRILINPFYAITVDHHLMSDQLQTMSRATWVEANKGLVQHLGSEQWLTHLLASLQGSVIISEEYINPAVAIAIDPLFAEPHPLLLTCSQWVQANANLLNELGTDAWLTQFLAVLEGDIVTTVDIKRSPHAPSHLSRAALRKRTKRNRRP